jgi:hypothetical protein
MRACVLAALASGLASTATAAHWHPVPGAQEVQVDVESLRVDRQRASAWLRWWGPRPLLGVVPVAGLAPAAVHRSSAHVEFDCSRRTARLLALNAWDARGTPLMMSSVPGPQLAVGDETLGWTHDAVCEAVRSAGRPG